MVVLVSNSRKMNLRIFMTIIYSYLNIIRFVSLWISVLCDNTILHACEKISGNVRTLAEYFSNIKIHE